jgi:hypothetical protein
MNTLVERSADYLTASRERTRYEDITGRESELIRHKARQHKQARIKWPTKVLKWDSTRQDYVPDREMFRDELEISESFLLQILFVESLQMTRLNELSLRSISVAAFTAALLGWAKRLDQHYSNQKSVASKMKQSDDPNVKLEGEARENEAEMFKSLGKMLVRAGGISASGSLGIDRAYKYLVKQEKKRR